MIKLVKDFDKLNRTDAINTKGGRTAIMQGETFYSEMRPRAGGFGGKTWRRCSIGCSRRGCRIRRGYLVVTQFVRK